ncbi:MAG TPA: prepilin-type N-terminal cleavage/methylation domain-containing protein [Kiritimatiellia bacterium]|nr:prepilin-type N-terminal cleavage/methylation domain-containing protein [Kiritimatiellia bacterium]
MKQRIVQQGFTLVELLVTIAIIAILAGILLPAVIGAFKKAAEAQARSEVKSIETAVRAYVNEYSRFPEGNGQADNQWIYGQGTRNNRDLMNVLRGINTTLNPRRIIFLEIQEKSLNASGDFIDPWDNQYRIALDTSFNNVIETGVTGIGSLTGRTVAVWSLGVNGTGTNTLIKSW